MRYSYLQCLTQKGTFLPFGSVTLNGESLFYIYVYGEEDDRGFALDDIWQKHNRSSRPRGQEIRSMCAGDVVVYEHDDLTLTVHFCDVIGWKEVKVKGAPGAYDALVDIAQRKAYGVVETVDLLSSLER